jgi:hypothetical protein
MTVSPKNIEIGTSIASTLIYSVCLLLLFEQVSPSRCLRQQGWMQTI